MEIDTNKIATSPFAVGFFGTLVALRGTPGATWGERLFNLASGTMLAGFVSPGLAEYFGLTSQGMQSAAAFVVGLFGLNITATVFQWLKELKLADLLPWRK